MLFERGRSTAAAAGEGSEQNRAPPRAAAPSDTSPAGVSAAGDGSASAEDLPF